MGSALSGKRCLGLHLIDALDSRIFIDRCEAMRGKNCSFGRSNDRK